jgi:hypothetical protein
MTTPPIVDDTTGLAIEGQSAPEEGTLEFYLAQIPDEYGSLEGVIARVFETGQNGALSVDRVQGWIDEIISGDGRSEDDIRDDIVQYVITKEVLMDFYGVDEEQAEALIDGANEGGINFSAMNTGDPEGVEGVTGSYMEGGTIVKITGGNEDVWGVKFSANGVDHIYTFNSPEEMHAALGPNAPLEQGFDTVNQDDVNVEGAWIMGDAAMWAGQEGSYQLWWEDYVDETARMLGINDPGRIGRMMADPEIANIYAQAAQAGWTGAELQAALRNSNYWTEVLYPGIEEFYQNGSTTPENDWKQFAQDVESNLRLLGYGEDENGSMNEWIGKLLDSGIEEEDFNTFAPIYYRAQTNDELKEALGFWLQEESGRSANFDDIFDVMAGMETDEVAQAVEKGIIQFHAAMNSTLLSPEQISRIADMTELTEQQIAQSFNSVEETLLALGDQALGLYGLTEEALVSAAFDLPSEEGVAANVTRRLARKTITERGLADDPKAQFFQSFDASGRPIRPGLIAGAPEAG